MDQFSDLYKKLLDSHVEQPALQVEREWIIDAQTESDEAVDKVVATCHKLIIRLACKIVSEAGKKSHHEAHDALLSAGYAACRKAVFKFDLENAAKARFSTFAYRHIYGEMLRVRHEDTQSVISVPYKFRRVLNEGIDESSETEDVKHILKRAVSSTFTPVSSLGLLPGEGEVSVEDQVVDSLMDAQVCEALDKLPTIQQYVVGHLWGACGFNLLTVKEIAALYDLESRVVSAAKLSALKSLDDLLG